jgi:hypothetical protein
MDCRICLALAILLPGFYSTAVQIPSSSPFSDAVGTERQLTHGPGGRILTNIGVWSPDGKWMVYDTRPDAAGERFEGSRIEAVEIATGRVVTLYETQRGAHCGVATLNLRRNQVVFILGPEDPSPDWQYCAFHRQGIIVAGPPGDGPAPPKGVWPSQNLDARDIVPPFTPGALRGGSHVHVWDASGDWVSFTYEDHVLAAFKDDGGAHDLNQRNVGVSVPARNVRVPRTNPRNHDGAYFSVLVTRTVPRPEPGSDQILRACEEGWIGTNGYVRNDGSRQRRALAFLGHTISKQRETLVEVFVADLPEDLTLAGDGPLAGTETRLPAPPRGVVQRRLTFTGARKYPGVQGPRHWLRCSPDGERIAFLMKDDDSVVQIWTVSPRGSEPVPLTRNEFPVASAFTWSPDGRRIGYVMDGSVCVSEVPSGETRRLTPKSAADLAPRPEACVFSPDGSQIAYVRRCNEGQGAFNQIFVVKVEGR